MILGGLIFATVNDDHLKELDKWREFGFPVFAPSFASAELEINRAKGMRLLEEYDIPVPKYHTFASLKDAEKFAMKQSDPYVFKTMGDEEDKSLSYVASDAADMVGVLRRWQAQGMTLKGPCMLQEKIDGCEMGISNWMGADGFLPHYNENFEFKPLMPGNLGPNTGEMGTVLKYTEKSKLADAVLKPLEKTLREVGHIGDIDLNCIIEKKTGTPYCLEFTARPGWPFFMIVQALHQGDPAQWMVDLLKGKDSLKCSYDVAVGVVIAQPPFPYGCHDKKDMAKVEGIPVGGLDDIWEDVHPCMMMMARGPEMDGKRVVERDIPQAAGDYVCVVSGTGKTVSAAAKACYASADQVKIKNKIMRNDIGAKLEAELPELHKLGYAEEMEY